MIKNRDGTPCILIWPRLWNFIGSQAKFNSFLVTNEYPERICLYLVREFDDKPSKIGHFQISKSIFGAKRVLIFLRQKFLFEYQIRRTTFIKSMYFYDQSEKTLFSKNEPYFWQLVIKLSYKIQTNPFRMFICDHKTIEFHLTHYEMPQPWSCYTKGLSFRNDRPFMLRNYLLSLAEKLGTVAELLCSWPLESKQI